MVLSGISFMLSESFCKLRGSSFSRLSAHVQVVVNFCVKYRFNEVRFWNHDCSGGNPACMYVLWEILFLGAHSEL